MVSQALKVNVAEPLKFAVGIKRIESAESNSNALLLVAPTTLAQPLPLSNCQVPLVLSTAVTAMDSTATSASVIDPSTTIEATVSPVGAALSSLIVVNVGNASANTGASFSGVTVMVAESVVVLNAVVVPVTVVSAVLPADPVEVSQARNVIVAELFELALGM